MKRRLFLISSIFLLSLLSGAPSVAFAHGGGQEPAAAAGPLSWGFLGFGALVIVIVSFILYAPRRSTGNTITSADFERLTGFRGYLAKMRLFSRNARLFILHVVGMDVIYGTWTVVFNLYLLAVGFDVAFIGLRILLAAIMSALFSIPAGFLSDRLGRKLSFILGDGGGAVIALVAISTTNPTLLLLTAAVGGIFGAVHGVAEPAFMAENSRDFERVHLFSVADGTRVAAAIIGSALAGLVPFLLAGNNEAVVVELYRVVAYVGIGGWFASLIPAVLLERVADRERKSEGLRSLFAGVKHPGRIWRLTVPEVALAIGAGFTLPLLNVFFSENLGSMEIEIGATFAAGQAFLVVGAFLAPLLAARLGKVHSVLVTRLAGVPFILLFAFSPEVGGALGSVFAVAALAHIARIALSNMASPVRSAFAMEILDPGERGTQVGIQMALASALSGATSYLGSRMMAAGDFRTPFFLMAGFFIVGALLFWRFFAGWETEGAVAQVPSRLEARPVGD